MMRNSATRFWIIFLCSFLLIGRAFATDEGWPREFKDSRGTHILTQPPQRIVSTSITLTGSLLAIDAPVIASGTTTANNQTSDAQGFFRQWGEIARERGVAKLGRGEISVETIAMLKPDLILVSASGGDSALAFYEQLSGLAPVIVVSYDDKSWQQMLRLLSTITGHEKQAEQRIADFDTAFTQMKQQLTLAYQPVNAMVWDIMTQSASVWTSESAQGKFLIDAGIELAPLPQNVLPRATPGKRHDIVLLEGENLVTGLNGQSLLLFAADESDKESLLTSPLLGHLPAIQANHVYVMGSETFRLDYYSAMGLIKRINELFGSSHQPAMDTLKTPTTAANH